jgi:hypothetical protein
VLLAGMGQPVIVPDVRREEVIIILDGLREAA